MFSISYAHGSADRRWSARADLRSWSVRRSERIVECALTKSLSVEEVNVLAPGFQYELRQHIEKAILAIQVFGLRADEMQRRGVVDTLERYQGNVANQLQSSKQMKAAPDAGEENLDEKSVGSLVEEDAHSKEEAAEREGIEKTKQLLIKMQSIKEGKDDWELHSIAFTYDNWKRQLHDEGGGRVITYGWVMIANVWIRQLCTQGISAQIVSKYPGIGLYILAIIYLLLTGALGYNLPYRDIRITMEEAVMSCLIMLICGMGGLSSMLKETRQQIVEKKHDDIIGYCDTIMVLCIVTLAIMLFLLALFTAFDKAHQLAKLRKGKKVKAIFEAMCRMPRSKSFFRRSDDVDISNRKLERDDEDSDAEAELDPVYDEQSDEDDPNKQEWIIEQQPIIDSLRALYLLHKQQWDQFGKLLPSETYKTADELHAFMDKTYDDIHQVVFLEDILRRKREQAELKAQLQEEERQFREDQVQKIRRDKERALREHDDRKMDQIRVQERELRNKVVKERQKKLDLEQAEHEKKIKDMELMIKLEEEKRAIEHDMFLKKLEEDKTDRRAKKQVAGCIFC